jgi:hypothetical protein
MEFLLLALNQNSIVIQKMKSKNLLGLAIIKGPF